MPHSTKISNVNLCKYLEKAYKAGYRVKRLKPVQDGTNSNDKLDITSLRRKLKYRKAFLYHDEVEKTF